MDKHGKLPTQHMGRPFVFDCTKLLLVQVTTKAHDLIFNLTIPHIMEGHVSETTEEGIPYHSRRIAERPAARGWRTSWATARIGHATWRFPKMGGTLVEGSLRGFCSIWGGYDRAPQIWEMPTSCATAKDLFYSNLAMVARS